MIRAAVAAMAILLPVAAQAGPAATVIGCPFTAAAIERALAHELVGLGRADERVAPVVVTCAADGVAQLVVATVPPLTRAIDLGDVPPALAPRVVALLLASAMTEPMPAPPAAADPSPAPRATDPAPATETSPTDTPPTPAAPAPSSAAPSPAVTAPSMAPTAPPSTVGPGGLDPGRPAAPHDRIGLGHRRRPTLLGDRRWRLGVSGRAVTRLIRGNPGPLWGAGAAVVIGPLAVGVVHARGAFDHELGTLTPTLTALDGAITVACSRGETTTCLGARLEVGRGAVTAEPRDPSVAGGAVAGIALHGALELTVARELGAVELAGILAAGGGAGVVARANGVEAARLAGWTLGAALEVRR